MTPTAPDLRPRRRGIAGLRRSALPAVVGSLVVGVVLAGCTAGAVETTAEVQAAPTATTVDADSPYTAAVAALLAENADWTTVNDDEWDAAAAVDLAPTTGTTTITEAGVYRLSGDYGPVVVEAPDDALVVLVLEGATVEGAAGAAIDVVSADDVGVFLVDGTTNSVSATIDDAEAVANAAIHADADLTVSGTGALEVTAGGTADGITSTDDLVVLSGEIAVDAVDDALRGKDSLVIEGGTVTVTAGGDALKADQDEDASKGFIAILGGSVDATAGDDGLDAATDIVVADGALIVDAADDGLHGEVALAIGGGTVDVVRSEEGLEAFAITVEGGETSVVAADDGVNASGGDAATSGGGMGGMGGEGDGGQTVTVTAGSLTIDAGGDGLDSNGSASISGGAVVVFGPTTDGNGALDVNGELLVSGGELIAVGSAGMAVATSTASSQSWVAAAASAGAGSVVTVLDASGAQIATVTVPKAVESVVVSTAAITAGREYTIAVDGTAVATAIAGEFSGGGMGGFGGGGDRRP